MVARSVRRVPAAERAAWVEQVCDYFAGCLLMPRPALKRAWTRGDQSGEPCPPLRSVAGCNAGAAQPDGHRSAATAMQQTQPDLGSRPHEPDQRTAAPPSRLAGDQLLHGIIQARTSGADSVARRQRKRITDLETTRRNLLQAHLAGAVPVDLLEEEQDRIARELANAGAARAATEIDWEALQTKIDAALGFTTRLEDAYRHADGKTRRHLNQTIFEELRIDRGGITYARLSDPLAQLFAEDPLDDLRQESEHPGPVEQDRGVNVHHLVGVKGLEPLTPAV